MLNNALRNVNEFDLTVLLFNPKLHSYLILKSSFKTC